VNQDEYINVIDSRCRCNQWQNGPWQPGCRIWVCEDIIVLRSRALSFGYR